MLTCANVFPERRLFILLCTSIALARISVPLCWRIVPQLSLHDAFVGKVGEISSRTLSSALRSLWMRSPLSAYCVSLPSFVHFISRRLHSGMMSRSLPGPFPGPRTLTARGREELRERIGAGRAHAADRPTRPTRRRRTREGYRGRTQPSVSERSDSHLQRRREHAGYAALL